jgi:hypothetical protein
MKVLDLRCSHDHRFEGWFASDEDYRSQDERGLIGCPLCADTEISRLPSAPRLNVSKARELTAQPVPTTPAGGNEGASQVQLAHGMQQQWMRAVRHMMATTEDVGPRFPEEARRIHHGEVEARGIRGQASREEAAALRDEGIEVVAVALPDALKETLQ